MFSMMGLTRDQVDELRTDHHIYLLPSGRLSVTGCKAPIHFLPRLQFANCVW